MPDESQRTDQEQDAARYRWLREQADRTPWFWYDLEPQERDKWIDDQITGGGAHDV